MEWNGEYCFHKIIITREINQTAFAFLASNLIIGSKKLVNDLILLKMQRLGVSE